MGNRFAPSQSLHDRVIQAIKATQEKHDTYTNPGQEQNISVRIGQEDVHPDLVLCKPNTMTVEHVIEVETEESVTEAESAQWGRYSRGPGKFWLMVPTNQLTTAQAICRRKGIASGFGKWWAENGKILFDWVQPTAGSR